ncbi:energy transducer TonB family protein [Salegentibacter holothuriorum]|nr:energy transducer TonB [Salegentibacter holothuriorum]
MDFFEKHKALIITVLFCSVLILGLYNFNLSQQKEIEQQMLVDLEEYTKAKETKEENPVEEPKNKIPENSPKTHRAFNENQEAREENFNRELDEILKKNSAQQEEASNNENDASTNGTFATGKKTDKKRSDGDNTSEDISRKSGSLRNSSISFSLRGRNAVSIPNPIYTCDNPGKIVVNITVNAEGRVIDTDINKASSNSDNECLTEKALEYALNARFSRLAGRNEQPGTITYNFKP